MAAHAKKPSHTLRAGGVRAAIWLNDGQKGPFFSATFSRPFRDASGLWRNSVAFSLSDLEALMNAALEAKQWMASRGATFR